ncbi:hypothetical protein FMM79_10495 [Novosphingobium sp. BW1]|nr:hypothetical protein FMM79_10495 [Novosphingobium sp. BW1]
MAFHPDQSAPQVVARPIAAAMAAVLTALIWLPTLTAPQAAHAADVSVMIQSAPTQVFVAYAPTPVLM